MTKEVFPSAFNKVDEELIIECQYCRQLVSSFYLDEHEQSCMEKLSVQQMKEMNLIPQTKIQSTEINMIKSHNSDDEDFASVERTPSRNKVVHQVSNSNCNSSRKLGSSPFGIAGMTKLHS